MEKKYQKAIDAIDSIMCEGNQAYALENLRGIREELDIRIEAMEKDYV